jgi:hypothetical protein
MNCPDQDSIGAAFERSREFDRLTQAIADADAGTRITASLLLEAVDALRPTKANEKVRIVADLLRRDLAESQAARDRRRAHVERR